jgi:DNA-binding response OmpR family regulator
MIIAAADDDPQFLTLLEHWLTRHGHQVHCFHSGEEMVRWARNRRQRVDGAVVDVDMPGRNGLDCGTELRSLPSYADIPIVFVSAAVGSVRKHPVLTGGTTWVIKKDAHLWRPLEACLARLDRAIRTAEQRRR